MTITIKIEDASGRERKKKLNNEDGYRNMLSSFGVAFLIDCAGDEIEDFESLQDGYKYTLGDDSTPTIATMVKQAVKEASEYQKTQTEIMSKASPEFTNNLLSDLGYKVSMKPDIAGTAQQHTFDWRPSKEAKTPEAGERLATLMKPECMPEPLEFVPVTGFMLCEVKKGKRKTIGKTDLRVAKQRWTPPTDNAFSQARGLVELNIESNKFSESQLHLELVSVSMASVFKQGVALLATDCLTRWGVWSFESKNTISGVWYEDSREAVADFKAKLETVQERCDKLRLSASIEEGAGGGSGINLEPGERSGSVQKGEQGRVPEKTPGSARFGGCGTLEKYGGINAEVAALYEQDLSGFEEIGKPELQAFEREQFLTAFASALHNETGEECSVPIWARTHGVATLGEGGCGDERDEDVAQLHAYTY
jgi:hypothetical protein